jgi:L-rhamnose-H+ transport protein
MSYQNIFIGLLLIAIGAFTSGSFAIPFGKIKGWKWESYWLIYSLGAYILFPLIACMIFAPGVWSIYRELQPGILLKVFLLGAVYGVGNLSFGLSLRYLGISLGYALSLGLMLAIGTLIPPLMDGRLKEMIASSGGTLLIIGVVVSCGGIALSGWAGFLKDKIISDAEKKKSVTEFNLLKGMSAAILVGILMALTIVFATLWGLYRKEWKGAPLKIYILMIISLMIIIGSSFMIGISGSL